MENIKEYLIEDPKAVVLTIHGLGEHFGRYKHVGEWLNKNKIIMVGSDLPGFGTSTEMLGHIDNFNEYLIKVDDWVKYINNKWPNLPIFLFGHSLGGLIVLRYLEELDINNSLKGVIVTSPSISVKLKVPEWQIFLAKGLKKIYPTLRLNSGIKSEHVSRSPEIVEKYGTDPLNYGKVSAGLYYEFQTAIRIAWEKVDRINKTKIPILFLQAGDDQLVDANKADEFVKYINKEQITYLNIPGLYHEIINEPEKEIYLKMITEWILGKL